MLINRLKLLLKGRFVRNVSWMGASELINRIFRLGTTLTLARMFSSTDYGLVAILYTVADFANTFSLKYGIGAKIIQVDDEHLNATCITAYWLNWILCGAIFILQCGAAYPIARFYNNNQLILPICFLALNFLLVPLFAVQFALIQRENRLKITATGNVAQSITSNIMTVILALGGAGVWAVAIPMVLSTTAWIVIAYKNHPWRPPKFFQLDRWRDIIRFGTNMLGVDLLGKLRGNLDYLIIGRFVGVEPLGLYFFAFNAGLGISNSVGYTLLAPLFPHLCEARKDYKLFRRRYFNSLKAISFVFVPLILLQSFLAPFYVPIVFGQKWMPAIPILIIICLSAIPRPFAYAASQLLDSIDKTRITFLFESIFTLIFAIAILFAVQWGIFWVAVTVFLTHALVLPVFTIWSSRYALDKHFHPSELPHFSTPSSNIGARKSN